MQLQKEINEVGFAGLLPHSSLWETLLAAHRQVKNGRIMCKLYLCYKCWFIILQQGLFWVISILQLRFFMFSQEKLPETLQRYENPKVQAELLLPAQFFKIILYVPFASLERTELNVTRVFQQKNKVVLLIVCEENFVFCQKCSSNQCCDCSSISPARQREI